MTPELIEGSISNLPQRNQLVEHGLLTPIRKLRNDDKQNLIEEEELSAQSSIKIEENKSDLFL